MFTEISTTEFYTTDVSIVSTEPEVGSTIHSSPECQESKLGVCQQMQELTPIRRFVLALSPSPGTPLLDSPQFYVMPVFDSPEFVGFSTPAPQFSGFSTPAPPTTSSVSSSKVSSLSTTVTLTSDRDTTVED